jgi:AraC-like ligand binding domain
VTVSALSDRVLAESANLLAPSLHPARRVIELRRGGRALGGSYLYEGDALITGWHSHEVHQIEYAIGGVVEVETASAHYLLPPQQAAWIPAGLEHQATMNPDVRTVAVMFDPELVADGGDRARILAVSPLIREMMIYALRWPIDRPQGDAVSDAFFRDTRESGVRGARSRGAAEPADVRQSDRGGGDGVYERAPRVGDGVGGRPRGLGVGADTATVVPGDAGAAMADVSLARADAAGDGAAGRAWAVGAGDLDGSGFRQPQRVHACLHAVLRRDTVDLSQKGWRNEGLTVVRDYSIAGMSKQPFAQQRVHRFLPSLKLSGRSKTLREVPLDMAAQDDGAQGKHERVECGPRQIQIGARLTAFIALTPPGDAKNRQGVEDRGSQGAAVDERAADIVHDVGLLGDDAGHPASHFGYRVCRRLRNRRCDRRGHQSQDVVIDGLDEASLVGEMVLHQTNGHTSGGGHRAE